MRGQAGFFDVDERLKQLSAKGDGLERLKAVVDFELFRADLVLAANKSGWCWPAGTRSRSRMPTDSGL